MIVTLRIWRASEKVVIRYLYIWLLEFGSKTFMQTAILLASKNHIKWDKGFNGARDS